MPVQSQLINLLPQCQALLDDGANFYTTRAIPLKQVQSIYGVRARINQNNGSPISGFGALLAGLDRFEGDGVCVHAFTWPNGMFIVFTDAEVEKVIGTLTNMETEASTEKPLAAIAAGQ